MYLYNSDIEFVLSDKAERLKIPNTDLKDLALSVDAFQS